MPLYHFRPEYAPRGRFNGVASEEAILNEPGIFAASPAFAYEHGGPLTRYLLGAIPSGYLEYAERNGLELNIDIRSHWMLTGEYPASPGYHCDAAQRETVFDAGANTVEVKRSLVGTISSSPLGVSNTQFVTVPFTLESEHDVNAELWKELDVHIRQQRYPTEQVPDGIFTEFTEWTPHTAAPAMRSGARLFMRVSCWTPPPGHEAGIAKTQQVYVIV